MQVGGQVEIGGPEGQDGAILDRQAAAVGGGVGDNRCEGRAGRNQDVHRAGGDMVVVPVAGHLPTRGNVAFPQARLEGRDHQVEIGGIRVVAPEAQPIVIRVGDGDGKGFAGAGARLVGTGQVGLPVSIVDSVGRTKQGEAQVGRAGSDRQVETVRAVGEIDIPHLHHIPGRPGQAGVGANQQGLSAPLKFDGGVADPAEAIGLHPPILIGDVMAVSHDEVHRHHIGRIGQQGAEGGVRIEPQAPILARPVVAHPDGPPPVVGISELIIGRLGGRIDTHIAGQSGGRHKPGVAGAEAADPAALAAGGRLHPVVVELPSRHGQIVVGERGLPARQGRGGAGIVGGATINHVVGRQANAVPGHADSVAVAAIRHGQAGGRRQRRWRGHPQGVVGRAAVLIQQGDAIVARGIRPEEEAFAPARARGVGRPVISGSFPRSSRWFEDEDRKVSIDITNIKKGLRKNFLRPFLNQLVLIPNFRKKLNSYQSYFSFTKIIFS